MTFASTEQEMSAGLLRELASAQWLAVWAQGGRIDQQPLQQGPTFDGGIVIETARGLFSIGAYSVPDPDDIERFDLYVEKLTEVGTPEAEKLYRPKRRRVSEYPAELQLEAFLGDVEKTCDLVMEETSTGPHLVGAIVSAGALRLMFWADPGLPESCAMTTDAATIDELLQALKQ